MSKLTFSIYAFFDDAGNPLAIWNCYETFEAAQKQQKYEPPGTVIKSIELEPREAAARLIESWWCRLGHQHCVVAAGSRDELVESGLACDYMFEVLGSKRVKSWVDEFGDKYRLRRKKNGFEIYRTFETEPKKPFGWAKRKPFDVMPRVLEIRDHGMNREAA